MITSKLHGLLDYVTVLLFTLAPTLFNLSETGAVIAYIIAAVHLLLTLVTGFSAGAISMVAFQLHGRVELAVGLILAVAPWLLGSIFTTNDQLFFSIAGAIILIVYIVTTYRSPLHKY